MDNFVIRPATGADAAALARLANELDADQGGDGDIYSEAVILRDGFGAKPAVSFLIAELEGEAVGYAMVCDFYNSDQGLRALFLNDLYMMPKTQGRGYGRRVMAAVAGEALRRGAGSVWWGVYDKNTAARAFYASIGARDEDARILEIDGDALAALALEEGS